MLFSVVLFSIHWQIWIYPKWKRMCSLPTLRRCVCASIITPLRPSNNYTVYAELLLSRRFLSAGSCFSVISNSILPNNVCSLLLHRLSHAPIFPMKLDLFYRLLSSTVCKSPRISLNFVKRRISKMLMKMMKTKLRIMPMLHRISQLTWRNSKKMFKELKENMLKKMTMMISMMISIH